MAEPTQLDRIEATLALHGKHLDRIDLQNGQQTALLTALTQGQQLMATVADDTAAAVGDLDTKVDTLLSLVQPSIQSLRDQLAAAQALVQQLQAGDAAAGVTLTSTIAAAQAEATKVQTAIDAMTPVPPGP